jgi:hypothetical protein
MTLKGVQVGDSLFTVTEKRNGGTILDDKQTTVTKVGRRWVIAEDDGRWSVEHRFDITTGHREHSNMYLQVTAFRTEAEGLAYVADLQLRAELRPAIYRHIDRWQRWPTSLQVRLLDLIVEAGETHP